MPEKLMMTERKQKKRIRLREKQGIFISFLICILQSKILNRLDAMRYALCALRYFVMANFFMDDTCESCRADTAACHLKKI